MLTSNMQINNFNNHSNLKLLINISTLSCTIFAMGVSLFIIGYICVNCLRKHGFKKSLNVSLLLTCNTCLAVICSSCTLTLMILSSIGGDLNIYALKQIGHWNCHLRGYLHFVFINSIYLSYVLQSGFRLLRIALYQYKCLRTIYSFSFFIFVQWILSFLLITPILVGNKNYSSFVAYLPEEFYCQVPMNSIQGIIFSIFSVYFVPLCCIGMIYVSIIIYIRRINRQVILVSISLRRKKKRDSIIIKRIFIVIFILLSLGIPSCLFVVAFIITGYLHWTCYRVGWMTISISLALISLSSVYVTPQIYKSMHFIFNYSRKKKHRQNTSRANRNISVQRKTDSSGIRRSITTSTV